MTSPSTQANNKSNLKVCGRFLEEMRVLGCGQQGSVSLCKDRASGKPFALKTSAANISHEFATVRLLMDGGVHEGIVGVHGMDLIRSGPRAGQNCLMMDFCNGGSLLTEVMSQPGCRLGERKAAMVVSSIALALSRCHKMGIIHRDVKPENILLHANNFLLADFGLAKKFTPGHLITDRKVAGTFQYMSPEMMQGAYDDRADVWSLGMVLHVILTGFFPSYIEEETQPERMLELCPDDLDLAAFPIYAELSHGARSLLSGMLRKNPKRRFTMAQVVAHPWLQQSRCPRLPSFLLASSRGGCQEPNCLHYLRQPGLSSS